MKQKFDITTYGFIVIAFGIVILASFIMGFFMSVKFASASVWTYGSTVENAENGASDVSYVQTFTADNSLSYNYFSLYNDYGTWNTKVYLCKGTFAGDGENYLGCGSDEFKWMVTAFFTSAGTTTIEIDTTLVNGDDYYIKLINQAVSTTTNELANYSPANPFSDGIMWVLTEANLPTLNWWEAGNNYDLWFEFSQGEPTIGEIDSVEIIEIDYGYEYVQIGNESLTINDKICFASSTCKLTLNYGFEHVDENLVIYRTDSDGTLQLPVFATTTLANDLFLQELFTLDDQISGTVEYFRAFIVNDFPDTYSNIARVEWWTESDYADDEYFLTDACSDMTSTTWEFWNPTTWAGGMGYAMECSLRKASYWAFTPKPSTYIKLGEAKDNILQEFPFNIFFISKSLISIASSTATSTWEIPVNWIASSSTGTIATLSLSNETISNDYPTLWEKFMLMQTIVFYAFGFGVIWFLSLKILKLGSRTDDC